MHRGFDRPTDDGTYTPTRMNINYGNNHPAPSKYRHLAHTWRPVVFGNDLDDWNWMWSKERPVHFICHSQGGNTVRYLMELLTGRHQDMFPGPDFPTGNCQAWVKSVVTIGTPHKGTTVTDVVQVRNRPPKVSCPNMTS
jgi:triacylglycerol esterase/lipase EstA (alpha/beta hydrolase family)